MCLWYNSGKTAIIPQDISHAPANDGTGNMPNKQLASVFGVIDKSPLRLGTGVVLCVAEKLNTIDKDNRIAPVRMI